MNSAHLRACLAATVVSALFFAGDVLAQMNKCVDRAGKTTYSDKPCPSGQSAVPTTSPVPAPVKPASRAMGSTQGAGEGTSTPEGYPPSPNIAAKECAERWAVTWPHIKPEREYVEKARIESDRQRAREREAQVIADFLRPCARHGFVSPVDDRLKQQNDQVAERVKKKYAADYERRVAWEADQKAKQAPPASTTLSSAAAAPARTPSSAASSTEVDEMQQCVDDWENEVYARKTAGIGFQGRKPDATWIKFETDRRRNVMARLLSQCKRFGFEEARDEAGERRNNQLVERLKPRIDAAREKEQSAEMQESIRRDSSDRAAATAREQEALKRECDRERKSLDAALAEVANLPKDQQDAYRGNVDKAETQWRTICAP